MKIKLQILFLILLYSYCHAQSKMEKSKSIKAETYSVQVPESWTKIEFDKNKYELALTTGNKENSIYFNIKKCYKKFNTNSPEGEFGFGRMRVNILNEPIKNIDETYCGNIDVLNRNEFEYIVSVLESIKPQMIE